MMIHELLTIIENVQSQERGIRNTLLIHINVLKLVKKLIYIYIYTLYIDSTKQKYIYTLKKRRGKRPNISKD